jgi:hypothetical protein
MPTPYSLDCYVVDVLLPDLVGHDRKPAAFLVLIRLLCTSDRRRKDLVEMSLQEIATSTGLAKSTVQAAIRHLKHRGFLDPDTQATTSKPLRKIVRSWNERKAGKRD